MSLEGRLEDLGICSILQLISLGKKSGTLTLKHGAEKGLVSFVKGQVVVASSSRFPQGLGELLLSRTLVNRQQLDEAIRFQQKLKKHQPLGVILKFFHTEGSAAIEQAVIVQIERIIVDFCSWSHGYFSFCLEPVDTCGSAWLNPLDLILEKGFCPLRIALKGHESSLGDDLFEQKLNETRQRRNQGRVDLLRGMLTELQHPDLSGGILLLILRYASELMERAIIFDVRGTRLVGLGQFGLPGAESTDQQVRQLDLDISTDPLFLQATDDKKLVQGSLNVAALEPHLRAVLGNAGDDGLVAPLTSHDSVVALLYGDGFHSSVSPLALDAFALFLERAGIAMEQALDSFT